MGTPSLRTSCNPVRLTECRGVPCGTDCAACYNPEATQSYWRRRSNTADDDKGVVFMKHMAKQMRNLNPESNAHIQVNAHEHVCAHRNIHACMHTWCTYYDASGHGQCGAYSRSDGNILILQGKHSTSAHTSLAPSPTPPFLTHACIHASLRKQWERLL